MQLMYLSGTSMATPVVSGAAALMLQANPKLTPNMVKMILAMYSAQRIAGFNTFEQGAGSIKCRRRGSSGKISSSRFDELDTARNTDADDKRLCRHNLRPLPDKQSFGRRE